MELSCISVVNCARMNLYKEMCNRCSTIPEDETCSNCKPDVQGSLELCDSCFEKKLDKLERLGMISKRKEESIMSKAGIKTTCCNVEPYSERFGLKCSKCNRDVTFEITAKINSVLKKKEKEKVLN